LYLVPGIVHVSRPIWGGMVQGQEATEESVQRSVHKYPGIQVPSYFVHLRAVICDCDVVVVQVHRYRCRTRSRCNTACTHMNGYTFLF